MTEARFSHRSQPRGFNPRAEAPRLRYTLERLRGIAMIDYVRTILASQYAAALRMVKDCVVACPADHWNIPIGTVPFGGVAYHALFFADMYLSPSESTFTLGDVHRIGGDVRRVGFNSGMPAAETLAYADDLVHRSAVAVGAESPESLQAHCGFSWLKVTRGELHIYNIRHLQHHAGALGAVLRRAGIGASGLDPMEWIDSGDWQANP